MVASIPFNPGHEDLIHDVSFDFYGKRIATCSSDQKIKVFDINPVNQTWTLNEEWKGHDCSVVKVKWAHPEFGQVIVSSSFDRTARIWEEVHNERARLVDSRGAVQDVAFAPRHLGLKIATASTDGVIRIYEAMDLMNLAHWTLMEDFEIYSNKNDVDGQLCISWCPSRFLPTMLAVGCGKENVARIYKYDDLLKNWGVLCQLDGHFGTVLDVAWAPNLGRSYELIATACKDHHVRIYKVSLGAHSTSLFQESSVDNGLNVKMVGDFSDHDGEVWRVSWNITGTVLSSAGEDGKVKLWKLDIEEEQWKNIASLPHTVKRHSVK